MPIQLRTPRAIAARMAQVMQSVVNQAIDTNVGAVIQTAFEAVALQIAGVYAQISRVYDSMFLYTATGEDLDRKAADFGLTREGSLTSSGAATVTDPAVSATVYSGVSGSLLVGATAFFVDDTSPAAAAWPTSGSVVLDREDPARRETLAYTSVVVLGATSIVLNLSQTPIFDHPSGRTATLSNRGSDLLIPSGTQISAPATSLSPKVTFKTTEDAVIYDGERTATVPVESTATGPDTNVGPSRLTVFDSPPFVGATVTNSGSTTGGRLSESDAELRNRIVRTINLLSKGTLAAIVAGVIGLSKNGLRVVDATCYDQHTTIDFFLRDAVLRYKTVGEAIEPETVLTAPVEVLAAPGSTVAGDKWFRLANWPVYQFKVGPGNVRKGDGADGANNTYVFVAATSGAAASITTGPVGPDKMTLTGLSGIDPQVANPLTPHRIRISGAATAANNGTFLITDWISATSIKIQNAAGFSPDGNNGSIVWSLPQPQKAEVSDPDVDWTAFFSVYSKKDFVFVDSQGNMFRVNDYTNPAFQLAVNDPDYGPAPTAQTPIVPGPYSLVFLGTAFTDWTLLSDAGDFMLNDGFELLDHEALLITDLTADTYTYWAGLRGEVYRVVSGDPDNPTAYPGLKAAGPNIYVAPAINCRVQFTLAVVLADGYIVADVDAVVRNAVRAYIDTVKIGGYVYVSKVIQAAVSVAGVENARIVAVTAATGGTVDPGTLDVDLADDYTALTDDADVSVV